MDSYGGSRKQAGIWIDPLTRWAVGMALLVVVVMLISFPGGALPARILVAALSVAAASVIAIALTVADAEGGALKPSHDAAVVAGRSDGRLPAASAPGWHGALAGLAAGNPAAPETIPWVPPTMPSPELTPPASPTFEPRETTTPRFGRASRIQELPWRLPAEPSPVSGVVADEAEIGTLTVRAASVIGPGHRYKEPATVRQDAYRLGRDASGDYLVLALADGVSGSRRSDLGATVAVGLALSSTVEMLGSGLAHDPQWTARLFATVAKGIHKEAAERGLPDTEVCTALIVAVIPARPGAPESGSGWAAWVGDVSLWQLGGGRWSQIAGDRKRDEGGIASNELRAVLPHQPAAAQSCTFSVVPGHVLAFVTDGVGDGLARLPPLHDFLAKQWATPPPITDFISHVGFNAEQFHDDRSAAVVWPGRPG